MSDSTLDTGEKNGFSILDLLLSLEEIFDKKFLS